VLLGPASRTRYLENRGVTVKQTKEPTRQVEKMMVGCTWKLIGHITADSALHFLGQLRRDGRSAQTYNHYGPFQENCNTNEKAHGQEKGSDPNGTAACEA
jgi:hypothetical protein